MKNKKLLPLVLLLLVGTLATLAYVRSRSVVTRVSLDLSQLLRQEQQLLNENKRLNVELERRLTPTKIEKFVEHNLDLLTPAESQVIVIEEKR